MTTALSKEQIAVYLGKLTGWRYEDGALKKSYELSGFRQAVQFAAEVADIAEHEQHHPDLFISRRSIAITLQTHDVNGVTGKDFLLAEQIEKLTAESK